MSKPVAAATVHTTLKRAKDGVNYLGQQQVPIFFDKDLFTKVSEIAWNQPDNLMHHTM